MNYDDCLKVVKAQNPKMPYKQQQKAASEMFQNFKNAQSAHATNDRSFAGSSQDSPDPDPDKEINPAEPEKPAEEIKPADDALAPAVGAKKTAVPKTPQPPPVFYKPQVSKRIPISELSALEKNIRAAGVNRNSIIAMAQPIIPEGELKIEDKEGVNYLVKFEDKYGNKVPVYGYFKIFIAGGPDLEKFRLESNK